MTISERENQGPKIIPRKEKKAPAPATEKQKGPQWPEAATLDIDSDWKLRDSIESNPQEPVVKIDVED